MAKRKFNDLGLGTKNDTGGYRALNKDGTFNVQKINIPLFERLNFFHALISMSWARFFALILVAYFSINILFASIYIFIGVENLTGIAANTTFDRFMEGFFFSAQTVTTLGYGRVAPMGYPANIVAAVESMLGLLGFALATGLLYGRFSRPRSKIRYSENALIAPYHDINGFMFRIANLQNNQLLEMEVQVNLAMQRQNSELRDFYVLELERNKVAFMPYMWTIVHPIDKKSPLYGLTEPQVLEKDAEFIISIKAFDESSSQTVYSRSSYKANELQWGKKFIYASDRRNNGIVVDIGRINETQTAPLNA
ncbi:MAG: ion channel [Bacteroidota bacterium]